MKRAARGQSVVELCLSLIVFITVVMFGIHFAEVGYLSLKVHEAAVSPLWDATALRTHKVQHRRNNIVDSHYFHTIPPRVMQDARRRYNDFDGRRSSDGNTSISHVFTEVRNMNVHCRHDNEVEFDVPRGHGGDENASVLDSVYQNVGGMSCSASAQVRSLPSLPSRFLEGAGGFFKAQHSTGLMMTACASGRAVGGSCEGRYGILLGDYSFVDADVVERCPLRPERPDDPCPENAAYYYAALSVFDANGRSAGNDASKFAEYFAGFSPIDESGFFMSYRPQEDDYVEPLTPPGEPEDEAERPRNTGGVDHRPAVRRPNNICFLGLNGC
jgi:hypothetical protein